jgi:medium-chain acyl-[acyl-carrier-protein] hydrolase
VTPLPPTRWCSVPAPLPDARLRLFCFPYAGAGASCYFQWSAALRPLGIEVCSIQLPGRENRLSERPVDRIAPLISELSQAIVQALTLPFCFFAHSMGSLVAFELMRALRERGAPLPRHFFVSGARPPTMPHDEEPLRHLPDAALIREVASRYGGIPAAVLQHQELLDVILPALRADMSVIETYHYVETAPFDLPVTAFAGEDDPHVDQAALHRWRDHTSAEFNARSFPGDHFYLQKERAPLIAAMTPGLLREMSVA